MLRERRELVERELRRLHSVAANMYLSIVISNNGDENNLEYQQIRESIADLVFELNMINELIDQGKE